MHNGFDIQEQEIIHTLKKLKSECAGKQYIWINKEEAIKAIASGAVSIITINSFNEESELHETIVEFQKVRFSYRGEKITFT